MPNRSKIFIILITVAVFMLGYLILDSRKVEIRQADVPGRTEKPDPAKLASAYRVSSQPLVMEYSSMLDQVKASSGYDPTAAEKWSSELLKLKENFMELRVPKDMREYHIKVVLSMDRLQGYLEAKDSAEIKASEQLLDEAKEAQKSWLN